MNPTTKDDFYLSWQDVPIFVSINPYTNLLVAIRKAIKSLLLRLSFWREIR
jgi:hypothetical protein